MLSRRRFLGLSGVGLVAASAGCQPPFFARAAHAADLGRADLKEKAQRKSAKDHLLGYPVNMRTPAPEFFEWRRELFEAGIDEFAFNNVGNPFNASPIPYNTHDLERETIRSFGKRFGFPKDDTLGFVSHSGTDSNMHGMYMGKTILKGRTGVVPRVYFTREAHYSVQILTDLLGLEAEEVATLPDASMNPEDLADRLGRNKEVPALVVATVGTTFKGAIDDVERIRGSLGDHPSYVHMDAALFGGYLPYTRHAGEVSYRSAEASARPRYDSIAVSCHKFFGFPSPAGLYVMTRTHYEEFNALFAQIHNPEYIHQVPGTITCSRDAVKPAEFHYFTRDAAEAQLERDARAILDNASYLLEEMTTQLPRLGASRSNPLSNTVTFRSPGKEVVEKYSLATMELETERGRERFAHAVVMPHVSREILAGFLEDVDAAGTAG